MEENVEIIEENLLIGGQWVSGSESIEVRNPAETSEVVGSIARGTADHVDKAVQAAKKAFPMWSSTPATERAFLLKEAKQRLLATIESRSKLLTRENGKVIKESSIDNGSAMGMLDYYSNMVSSLEDQLIIEDSLGKGYLQRKPKGVIAGIVPWNYPIILSFFKIAPALMAGNTMVLKPATNAPLALIAAVRELNSVLPAGVINIVTGSGAEVGRRLVSHPDVSMVAFTGGTEGGRDVMKAASQTTKKVLLELGGNDPAIILDDFDINNDELMIRMLRGVFNHTGQICFGLKRIYAPAQIYDQFVARFTELADTLVLGNGLDQQTTLGPMNNAAGLQFIQQLVSESATGGATIRAVGQVSNPNIFNKGYFHKPTIVSDIDHSARLVQVEQFGPAIPIVRYNTLEKAIGMANDTKFGLASSIWTMDNDRGIEVAGKIMAGLTFVNSHEPFSLDPRLPFGGVKESGFGRSMSEYGLDEYVDYHVISSRYNPR